MSRTNETGQTGQCSWDSVPVLFVLKWLAEIRRISRKTGQGFRRLRVLAYWAPGLTKNSLGAKIAGGSILGLLQFELKLCSVLNAVGTGRPHDGYDPNTRSWSMRRYAPVAACSLKALALSSGG
jgi:hypothetical protein